MSEFEKRVEQLEGYAKALIAAIRSLDQCRHILLPLLEDEELKSHLAKKFENQHGAYAYNHLIPLLAQDLIRDCSRLFLDEDKRTCSLMNIYRKASAQDMLDELRRRFRNIPDQFGDARIYDTNLSAEEKQKYLGALKEDFKAKYEEDFNSTWDSIFDFVASLEENDTATKLKTFRDKHFAHLEMQPLDQEPAPYRVESLGLKFNDIFQFMDECIKNSANIVRLITGTNHVIDSFSAVHKKRGESMWAILGRNE